MERRLFVTGIGTGIGKTVVSAILTQKLHASYWKPIQSGDLDASDTNTVKKLISNPGVIIFPEAYRLTHPLSPHLSAELDGVEIKLEKIQTPRTDKALVIEGAGGLMVPLNENELIIDLIKHLNAEVILVSRHYLGSINHTLLSAEVLKRSGLGVLGIIYNGVDNPSSREIIERFSGLKCLGLIPEAEILDQNFINKSCDLINL